MGYSEKTWDQWFTQIVNLFKKTKKDQSILENAFEKNHYKKNYENWVSYFALNLENITKEHSARKLDPTYKKGNKFLDNSAILSLYALVLSTESLRFETKSLIPAQKFPDDSLFASDDLSCAA